MAAVLDLVKHYQQNIEKYPKDDERILRSIDKLFHLDVTVQHLQETGVGRTVNALRKEEGDVGKAARALVYKWKLMVAAEDTEEDEEDRDPPHANGRCNDKDSDHEKLESRKTNPDIKNMNGNHSGTKRKYHSSEDEEDNKKKSKHSSSSEDDDRKKRPIVKQEPPDSDSSQTDSHSDTDDSQSSEEDRKEIKVKVEPPESDPETETRVQTDRHEKHSSSKHSSHHSSSAKRSKESSSRHSSESQRHSSEKPSKSSPEKSSKEKSHSSEKMYKDHKPREKENSKEESKSSKHSSERYRSSSHKGDSGSERHRSSSQKGDSESERYRSSSRKGESGSDRHRSSSQKVDGGSERHKSSSQKGDGESERHRSSSQKGENGSDRYRSSSQKGDSGSERHRSSSQKGGSGSERHSSSKSDKDKNKSSSDKESSSDKLKSKESSNSKEKSSSSSDKKKDKSGKEKSSSHSSRSDKNSSSSNDKSKSDSKSKESKNEEKSEKKSSHKSSSSSDKDRSSSSKSKEDKPKKKVTVNTDSDEGIGCESGASFAEALGMVVPSKPKKKQSSTPIKDSSSPNSSIFNELSPPSLLSPGLSLAPLPALAVGALPEISPNYKPRPPPKPQPHFDETAMSQVISSKNQRTKVYSGNKTYGKIPTLYEMCVSVLQEHIDALEYTGGVPYDILKPVIDKATPQQLFVLEHYNAYLMDDTDHLWQKHCEKHFRNKKREEMETWREMYLRCQEEQEHKLKSLTANIKMTQEAKKAPIKQTKMAYVDSVVKPPRNIARKQALHGTARAAAASPAARVAALGVQAVRRPINGVPTIAAASFKPKKAPLMQKALQFMRGRKR